MGLAKKMVIDSNAVAQEKGEEYVLSISSNSIKVSDMDEIQDFYGQNWRRKILMSPKWVSKITYSHTFDA